jgi:hypothetical protein
MKLFDEANCGGRVSSLFKSRREAFSRTDLAVFVFIVLLLGAWFVRGHTGEQARITRCANNLMVLGKAMHDYTGDHQDELPAAVIDLGMTHISWDTRLFPSWL